MSNLRIVYHALGGDEIASLGGRTVFYKTKRQAANAYRAAARFLEKNPERWVRGALWKGKYSGQVPSSECKVCAVGALNLSNLGDPRGPKLPESYYASTEEPRATFQGYLLQLRVTEMKVIGTDLVNFNDNIASGPTDVVKAMRKIASALDHGAAMEGRSNLRVLEEEV